jgi:hypothetical protein
MTQATLDNFVGGTLVPQAEKFIDTYCNHSFGTPSFAWIKLDGNGKDVLFFPPKYCPLIGFSSGTVDGNAITASDLKVYDQHVRYDGGIFSEGKKNVVLYGSFGYLGTMPTDIMFVCAQLCANVLLDMVRRKMTPDLFMRMAESAEPTLFAMPDIFQNSCRKMLDNYKITWIDVG